METERKELTAVFMDEVMAKLEDIRKATLLGVKEILRLEECALLTGFSETTIYGMTHRKQIPYFKRGGRLFFSKKKIEQWLSEVEIPTDEEISRYAETYTTLKKIGSKGFDGVLNPKRKKRQ